MLKPTDLTSDFIEDSPLNQAGLKVMIKGGTIEVLLTKPTIGDLIEIEETVKGKNMGTFEQSLLLLEKLIIRYGDKTSVSLATLKTFSLPDIKLLNQAFSVEDIDLDYDDVKTPSGNNAIAFNLRDGSEVIMIAPTVVKLIEIERDLMRRYKGAGELKTMLITVSKLIVKWYEKEGENIVSLNDLFPVNLQDWALITAASNLFFRS